MGSNIIELKEENKNMKNEINELKEENKKLNDKLDSVINKLQLTKENNNNVNENDIFMKSSILKDNINEINKIIYWIKRKINKNIIGFNLIFNLNKNGEKGTDFHKYCDNKGPTLILIKTKTNNIFGGFTPLNWKGDNDIRPKDNSNQTFIFSLDRNKIFDIIDINLRAIRCRENEGPVFGNCDFKLGANLRKIESYSNGNYFTKNNLELTGRKGNKETLETQEFEVFEVIY